MAVAVRRILAATDFSPASEGALRWGDFLAGRLGAELLLFHAICVDFALLVGPTGVPADRAVRLMEDARRRAERSMEELRRRFTSARAVVQEAPAREGIVRAAEAQGAHLVCVGVHRRPGLLGLLRGSVWRHVVAYSPVPVLTVPQTDRPLQVGCILVPTDFSPAADAALPWADLLARTFHARLVLLHVMEITYDTLMEVPWGERFKPAGEAIVRKLEEQARAQLQTRAQRLPPCETLVRTSPGAPLSRQRIVEAAAEVGAHLIVIGSQGRVGPDPFLFASIAEDVVRRSSVPVLTVPHRPRPSGGSGGRKACG